MESKTDEKPLIGKEAVDKMKELIGHNAVCMFTSNVEDSPSNTAHDNTGSRRRG